METLAADKHVIAKLPLVPFRNISLTRSTADVCMKVTFKSKFFRAESGASREEEQKVETTYNQLFLKNPLRSQEQYAIGYHSSHILQQSLTNDCAL